MRKVITLCIMLAIACNYGFAQTNDTIVKWTFPTGASPIQLPTAVLVSISIKPSGRSGQDPFHLTAWAGLRIAPAQQAGETA